MLPPPESAASAQLDDQGEDDACVNAEADADVDGDGLYTPAQSDGDDQDRNQAQD